jgi:hypothetical protein
MCYKVRLSPFSRGALLYLLCVWIVPPEVLKLKGRRGELGQTDCESDI